MFTNEKLLLSVPETAFALNCSSYKVYMLINDGTLGYKIWTCVSYLQRRCRELRKVQFAL